MKEYAAKGTLGALGAVIGYLAGCFNEMLVILAMAMILDYVIATLEALINGNWCKKTAIQGAIKKIGYMFCILLGFMIDYSVMWTSGNLNVPFNTKGFFGMAVTCYFFGAEGLSILKHLINLGVPVPPFLDKALGKIQHTAEVMLEDATKESENK